MFPFWGACTKAFAKRTKKKQRGKQFDKMFVQTLFFSKETRCSTNNEGNAEENANNRTADKREACVDVGALISPQRRIRPPSVFKDRLLLLVLMSGLNFLLCSFQLIRFFPIIIVSILLSRPVLQSTFLLVINCQEAEGQEGANAATVESWPHWSVKNDAPLFCIRRVRLEPRRGSFLKSCSCF